MNILFSPVEKKYRSSRPEVFCKKGVIGNFAKFTGKHLWQSLFFNKVVGLRPTFCKIYKNTFFHRTPPVAASENSHDDIIADKCFILVSVDIFIKLNTNFKHCHHTNIYFHWFNIISRLPHFGCLSSDVLQTWKPNLLWYLLNWDELVGIYIKHVVRLTRTVFRGMILVYSIFQHLFLKKKCFRKGGKDLPSWGHV